MNGFVRNKSIGWRHAMKRSVGPGHKISLDDLYEQYGEKHELPEGPEFVDWLRQIKLRDNSTWEIVYKDAAKTKEIKTIKSEKKVEEAEEVVRPIVKKDLEVSDITSMSVRSARDALKKITDLKLLTYALTEANQMSNKDTLCIMLRKRIQVLELTRR